MAMIDCPTCHTYENKYRRGIIPCPKCATRSVQCGECKNRLITCPNCNGTGKIDSNRK
jgi:DnaJ-class molecular chaperone